MSIEATEDKLFPDESYRRAFSERIRKEYPECDVGMIGRSILGKNIDFYKIGCGKKHILYVGAHHGMEYITSSVLYDFIEHTLKNNRNDILEFGINLRILLKQFTFWIIPCINPDGVELNLRGFTQNPLADRQKKMNGDSTDFSRWQANARGVDLNHNYNYGFFEYKKTFEATESISPGRTRYSGEYPESEPETKSLADFTRTIMPSLVLSLHTQGEEIYYSPESEKMAKLARRCAERIGYKVSYAEKHAAYGGFCDFTGKALSIPSLTLELGSGNNPLPTSDLPKLSARFRNIGITLPVIL